MEIRELETRSEWLDAYPVLKQLRTDLDEGSYLDYRREMTADGYRLFAGVVDGEIVALAGVGVQVNMYYGRHLWVYELITDRPQVPGVRTGAPLVRRGVGRAEGVRTRRPLVGRPAGGRPSVLRGTGLDGAGELRLQATAPVIRLRRERPLVRDPEPAPVGPTRPRRGARTSGPSRSSAAGGPRRTRPRGGVCTPRDARGSTP